MQILIDRGANFDNALPTAVDDYNMVQFLLGRGAKVVSAPGKISAITNAAGAGNTEVVRLLLSHADDAELDGSRDALNWAAAGGRIDTVRLLIEHGFSVKVTVKDCVVGETPLLAACGSRKMNSQRIAVARLLVKEGADVGARGEDGMTAAELLVHNDTDGLLQEDAELQEILTRTDTT